MPQTQTLRFTARDIDPPPPRRERFVFRAEDIDRTYDDLRVSPPLRAPTADPGPHAVPPARVDALDPTINDWLEGARTRPGANQPARRMDIALSSATPHEFDDSGMTPVVAEAYKRVLAKHPNLPPLRAIRVNPALEAAKLDGQYVGNGVIEVNPHVTDPARLERLLLHEIAHAGGADEPRATALGATPVDASPITTSLDAVGRAASRAIGIGAQPERTMLDRLTDVPRAAAGGLAGYSAGAWNMLEGAADALGLDRVSAYAREMGTTAADAAKTLSGPRTGAGPTEQAIYSGIESVGRAAPSLIAGALTGGPVGTAIALGTMGATTGGESYRQAKDAGKDVSTSLRYGAGQGLVEAVTELIPARLFLGDLAKRTGIVQMLTRQLVSEVPGEQVATILQDLNEWATLKPEAPFSAYLAERPSAAAHTLIATLVATMAQTAGGKAVERATRTDRRTDTPPDLSPPPAATVPPPTVDAPLGPPPPEPAPVASSPVAAGAPLTITARDPLPPEFTAVGEESSAPAPEPITFREADIDPVVPPSIVERAQQMRAEDPDIDQKAREMAERAKAAQQPAITTEDTGDTHKFSSTQINLPADVAQEIAAMATRIPDEDLAADGREAGPHVTVKYGLKTADPAEVIKLLEGESPITVRLGKTSHFAEEGTADVVKVDVVDSPELHRLHQKIGDALPNSDTHHDYKPHVTVGYVKPGLGAKYDGDASMEGQTVTVDRIAFSGKDGRVTEIPLTGASAVTRAPLAEFAQFYESASPAERKMLEDGAEIPDVLARRQASPITPSQPPGVSQALIDRKEAETRARAAKLPAPTASPAAVTPRKVKGPPSMKAQTPAAAAAEVKAEVNRVIDLEGAKSASDVQKRVLATLNEELETSKASAGFDTIEIRPAKAYDGREFTIWHQGEPIVTVDRYGTMKASYGTSDAIVTALGGTPSTGKGDEMRLGSIPDARNLTKTELYRTAQAEIAKRLVSSLGAGRVTVQIPGDGTFTIERNPVAITEVIARIERGGAATWRGLPEGAAPKPRSSGPPRSSAIPQDKALLERLIASGVIAVVEPAAAAPPHVGTPKDKAHVRNPGFIPRVSMTPSTYRDRAGWSVRWSDPNAIGPQRVFFVNKEIAQEYKLAVQRGASEADRNAILMRDAVPTTEVATEPSTEAHRAIVDTGTAADMPAARAEDNEQGETDEDVSAMPLQGTKLLGDLPRRPRPATARGTPLGPHEIARRLSQAFARLPIGTGRFRQHALGIYKQKPQVVRVRVASDLQTLFHEFGHHVDIQIMHGSQTHVRDAIAQELKALGAPTSKSSYTPKQRRREGAAEFFRLWMMEPEVAQAQAPLYAAEFDRLLSAQADLKAVLQTIYDQAQHYLSLSDEAQVDLQLDYGDESPIVRRAIDLMVGSDTDPRHIGQRLNDALNDDKLPFLRAELSLRGGERAPNVSESVYVLQRLLAGTGEQAQTYIEDFIRRADGTIIAPGLFTAIKKVPATHYRRWVRYMVARRAQEKEGQGFETGLTPRQIKAALDVPSALRDTFEAAAAGSDTFFDGMLTWAVERGYLTPELKAQFNAKNVFYVPFHRVDTVSETGTPPAAGTKRQNVSSFFKRFRGGGNKIQDPYITAIRNTHAIVRLAELNASLDQLANLADRTPGGGRVMERIDPNQIATRFNVAQVQQDVLAALEQAGAIIELPNAGLKDVDARVTVFTPAVIAMGDTGVITILRDGERIWYHVHDKAIWELIATKQIAAAGIWLRVLKAGASSLRRLAVATLGFSERNLIRDHIDAKTKADYRHTFIDTLAAAGAIVRNTDSWQRFKASKAAHSALVSPSVDIAKQQIRQLGHGPIRHMLDRTVLHPLEALEALATLSDSAPRLQAFTKVLAREVREGTPGEEAMVRAAITARQITQDFNRMGAAVREANQYIPFLGARIGGLTRAAQALKDDPVRYASKAFAYGIMPGLLLWFLNKDDEEYEEVKGWAKRMFWHVPIPGSRERTGRQEYLWLPRPWDVGDIGNWLETYLDWAVQDDPDAIARLPWQSKKEAWEILLTLLPHAALPPTEILANYDFFRNRNIVSPYDTGLPLEQQYSRWTSEVGKFVGPKIGLAPAHFDHLVYGFTGGYGRGVVDLADAAIDTASGSAIVRPSRTWSAVPGVGTFYRGDVLSSGAQSFDTLYRRLEELDALNRGLRRYVRERRVDDARRVLDTYEPLIFDARPVKAPKSLQFQAERQRLRRAATVLSELRRDVVQPIFNNMTITPDQKRRQLDRAQQRMVAVARAALRRRPLPARTLIMEGVR